MNSWAVRLAFTKEAVTLHIKFYIFILFHKFFMHLFIITVAILHLAMGTLYILVVNTANLSPS